MPRLQLWQTETAAPKADCTPGLRRELGVFTRRSRYRKVDLLGIHCDSSLSINKCPLIVSDS